MNIREKVTSISGIGPKYAKLLEKLKIQTIEDFLLYYPRTYQDRSNCKKINQLTAGETVLIQGYISSAARIGYGRKRTLKLSVSDGSGSIEIVFFNATYLEKTLKKESEYEFFGRVTAGRGSLQMLHPDFNLKQTAGDDSILPIYPLTQGITQNNLRKWQREALKYVKDVEEYLPEEIISNNRLCGLRYAIENIHFPKDQRKAKEAAYRLIFDELFILQLGLLSIKKKTENCNSGISFSPEIKTDDFLNSLPFKLTAAQNRVVSEVERDMESSKTMNRLIQGDVGSGKTAIAAAAAYKAIKSGYKVLMMAPTELLARQHLDSLSDLFLSFGITAGLLTGSMTKKQREDVLASNVDFLIGTHSLIQPGIDYKNVGLVITDEQHRFGVNQRKLLMAKGENPDILVMTATPIPRTLAVILYGDLDHSAIDEMPPGRKPILTKVVSDRRRDKAYDFLEEQIKQGRQAYIVTPLIEESEHINARSSTQVYEEVLNKFKNFNVKLLHGNMKQIEKDKIMEEFYTGSADIIVSTVVIEVGINVPNATVMLIENAERFGLATLHQLRGRVGRGEHQSYCILINDSKNEISKERAKVMEETNDGFIIAEKDLSLRGPGEFFGVRQHGIPQLRIADLSKHFYILDIVRKEAEKLLNEDHVLRNKKHFLLKQKVNNLFEQSDKINL